jgi:two-component system sensor histidine kinase TctE
MNDLFGRLSDAFAARDVFIANAAHQLRNPIAAIRAQAEAAEAAPEGVDLRARVADVAEAARRTSRLTQQLLSLEKARGRPEALGAQTVDIAKLAAEILRVKVPVALRRGVEVSLELEGAPRPVAGDPLLIGEAFENLLDNALRYGCAKGGEIRVFVTFEHDRVTLVVADDGPGVPADQRERVFERFQRGVEEGNDGCGLGLAIVREIALRHGGTAKLVEAPTGARFEMVFPSAPL